MGKICANCENLQSFAHKVPRISISGWNFVDEDSWKKILGTNVCVLYVLQSWTIHKSRGDRKKWGWSFSDKYLQTKILQTKLCGWRFETTNFGADLWPLQRGSVRLSGLCGADRCGFSLQAGAPRRVLCHTLQSGPIRDRAEIWSQLSSAVGICFNPTHRTRRSQSTHSQEPCE